MRKVWWVSLCFLVILITSVFAVSQRIPTTPGVYCAIDVDRVTYVFSKGESETINNKIVTFVDVTEEATGCQLTVDGISAIIEQDKTATVNGLAINVFDIAVPEPRKLIEEEILPSTPDLTPSSPPIPSPSEIAKSQCRACWDSNTETCYPIGKRIDDNYCDISKEILPQKDKAASCVEHYSCLSNLCDAERNTCLNPSIWSSFLNWLKSIFA